LEFNIKWLEGNGALESQVEHDKVIFLVCNYERVDISDANLDL